MALLYVTGLVFDFINCVLVMQNEIVAKIKAEASLLRLTNADLSKQVEGLQISRLNEVEELAYLRWVNSCLRDELRNSEVNSEKASSLDSQEKIDENVGSLSNNELLEYGSGKRLNLIKKLRKWHNINEDLPNSEWPENIIEKNWVHIEEGRSPGRRHSISGSQFRVEEMVPNKRRQSDGFMCTKELEKEEEPFASQKYSSCTIPRPQFSENCHEINKLTRVLGVEKRALRIPNPPPRPSRSTSTKTKEGQSAQTPQLQPAAPPPPPPPPPPKFANRNSTGAVQRAPQVVEFYHSLMKRDCRKESSAGGVCETADVSNVHSNMIGEIENRSSHLLAVRS